MAEELKTLVNEVTKLLDVHFNMISFDALAPDGLLQVLVDVLAKFDAMTRFEVKESEPEETIKHILVAMKKIQYQPSANESLDPVAFQRGLLDGHKRIIYPLLKWIFANKDFVRDSTYLARFLMPLSLPPEALAIPEISKLMAQYQQMVEEFMETHRAYKMSETEGKQLKELKGDNEAIELEIENVKKRIEKTQSRLDKIPNQELFLEVARGLRIEKDRQRELQAQLEEQKQALQKAYLTHERMQRELNSAKITTQSTSPEQLMDAIVEETSVLQFMVDVKLPQEVQTLEKELAVYQMVASEPNINKSYLDDLQHKIDSLNREIQGMVEAKMAATNNDNLMPFRQQASTVAKNREIAAEQLNRATKELCDTEAEIQEKQLKLQETIGEVVMRGDDLKQYVNTLRAKSSVYKQKRAELATLKNEVNDLTLTLENLKAQDPKLDFSHLDEMSTGNNSLDLSLDGPETQGIGELSRLVDGLSRAVKSTRDRVQPVSRQIRELRERVQDLREDEETKKQAYDALNMTLGTDIIGLQTEISEHERKIADLETTYRNLQLEQERVEMLIERAEEEQQTGNGEFRTGLKDSLSQSLRDEEAKLLRLQQEKNQLIGSKDARQNQIMMWADLDKLLQVKLKCCQDQRQRGLGGTMQIDRGAETFTLQ